jgi:hypothetical protein
MSFFQKIRGTIESLFQLGLGGPQLKNNAGVIEARNPADSNFVVVRGDTPVLPNDLVTKNYVDTHVIAATKRGQFLVSINGTTFIAASPVIDDTGEIVTDNNFEVVVELP